MHISNIIPQLKITIINLQNMHLKHLQNLLFGSQETANILDNNKMLSRHPEMEIQIWAVRWSQHTIHLKSRKTSALTEWTQPIDGTFVKVQLMCSFFLFFNLKHSESLEVCPCPMLAQLGVARIVTKGTLEIKKQIWITNFKKTSREDQRLHIRGWSRQRMIRVFYMLHTANSDYILHVHLFYWYLSTNQIAAF